MERPTERIDMNLIARIIVMLSMCAAANAGMAQIADTSAGSRDSGPRHLSLSQAVQPCPGAQSLHSHRRSQG